MLKVLVVDNHPVMLEYMSHTLEKEGHQVKTALDGLSSLDILESFHPDVVFIDLVMPNIGGEKLCRMIRRKPGFKRTHLVILSAIAAEGKEINVADYGANACIAKGPFKTMGKHVLEVISRLDGGTEKTIRGLQGVHSREITRELLSVKAHYETLLESMDEGIFEVTTEGRIVYANRIGLKLAGAEERDILGSNFLDFFEAADRGRLRESVAAGNLLERSNGETSFILDGKHVEIKIVPLMDEENKALVIVNDVTERKLWEGQLREAKKMESIGTLAAGIAHDFNNILMSIQGNVSLMLLDLSPEQPHFERLKSIEEQIRDAGKLTGQLLRFTSKARYEIRPINLNELIIETLIAYERRRKEIAVYREMAGNLEEIEGDPDQIGQVIDNLLENAGDAMPNGGQLYLNTQNTTHEQMGSNLYDPKSGTYVMFSITDTGGGMDREVQEHIFEPFYTTKEMGRGIGLGLASVYGIVKGHGGYIDVESRKGMGSTFKVYLPARQREKE